MFKREETKGTKRREERRPKVQREEIKVLKDGANAQLIFDS